MNDRFFNIPTPHYQSNIMPKAITLYQRIEILKNLRRFMSLKLVT